jgi:uncharacterized membrane-anchored protein
MTGDRNMKATGRTRPDRLPLRVAAVAFSVIGLAGPLMLATGFDPRPFAWAIAPLWLVVIGGVALWLRGWMRRTR